MTEQTFRDTPYKGLVPYSEEDAPFFFGREAEREIITANLMASRLTLLYGASGVGKSSVLRAGVAHNLQQLARKNLSERGTPEFGVVVFNSWRDNPVEVLELRLREALSSLVPNGAEVPGDDLRELPEILKAWSQAIDGDLFIILDQFEEYFLYHAQEDGDNSFAVQFPRAVNRPDLRVSFLISIREDALARLDRFKGRIPNLFDNYLRIDHLDRNAARAAITEPARTYNSLHPNSSISIEPALVDAVLDQVKTNEVVLGSGGRGVVETTSDQPPTDDRIETSYLQLVMTRLWQEEVGAGSRTLRLATLDSLGGAKRIVQTHVDAVMQRLEADEQRTAAQLFYYLVTRDGTKIAHTVSALSEYTRTDETRLTGLLEKLCDRDARILQPVDPPPGQPDSPRYEIRHDKLAAAILDWRRRYSQMEERAEAERLAIEQRQQAEAQARVEEKAKSAARLRLLSIALAVMTLLALAGAALAFKQR
ncbi:MAG TPA: ATP-binding protein, partial [Pyrinomonadaceae bacterium]|nr:ATP-binding protein [Pyrinomonadaceae bacterium]